MVTRCSCDLSLAGCFVQLSAAHVQSLGHTAEQTLCYSSNALCTHLSSVSDICAAILEFLFPLTHYLTCGHYNSSADKYNCTVWKALQKTFG